MKKCVQCENGSYAKNIVTNYKYLTPMGVVIIEGKSHFLKCEKCEHLVITGETYQKWNLLILKSLTEKSGALNAKDLQFILSVLPYQQKEIAEAMGKNKSTLTYYKNGKNPIDPLFDYAIRDVIRDFLVGGNETLTRLQATFKFEGETTIKKVKAN